MHIPTLARHIQSIWKSCGDCSLSLLLWNKTATYYRLPLPLPLALTSRCVQCGDVVRPWLRPQLVSSFSSLITASVGALQLQITSGSNSVNLIASKTLVLPAEFGRGALSRPARLAVELNMEGSEQALGITSSVRQVVSSFISCRKLPL